MIRPIAFYQIQCDTCGHKQRSPGATTCYINEHDFRHKMRGDKGWSGHGFQDSLDRCPGCTKKRATREAEQEQAAGGATDGS